MTKQFRGSYTVTITPFTDDGNGDRHVRPGSRFVDWQLAEGVPGLIILGHHRRVPDHQRRRAPTHFVEATVQHVAKRVPVLVGTMNAYTPQAVRYSREARSLAPTA